MLKMLLIVFILSTQGDHMISRFSAPNKYDQYPFGTRCKVIKSDRFDLYIQFSHDENLPDWHMMGTYEGNELDDYSNEMLTQIVELELE